MCNCPSVRSSLVQVCLSGRWRWLFCRNEDYNVPIATENFRRALPAAALSYVQRKMGNHAFRVVRPCDVDVLRLPADHQRLRCNVRNFLLVASYDELEAEHVISLDRGESFRASCVLEVIEDKYYDELN